MRADVPALSTLPPPGASFHGVFQVHVFLIDLFSFIQEPFGWLVDLINRFAFKGGFDSVVQIIEQTDKLSPTLLAALLKPFGLCAAYLNADVIGCKLGPTADKVVHYIKDLQPNDMKEKVSI